MPRSESVGLDRETIRELQEEFLARLEITATPCKPTRRRVIFIEGAPGVGKTTASQEMAALADAILVQRNQARFILAEHGLEYGRNVSAIVDGVVETLVKRSYDLVIDGGILETHQRLLARDRVRELGAEPFFIAITANPADAKDWAEDRYADGRRSSFNDWRCKRESLSGYMGSIADRSHFLSETLRGVPHRIGPDGVYRIENGSDKDRLRQRIKVAWAEIESLAAF